MISQLLECILFFHLLQIIIRILQKHPNSSSTSYKSSQKSSNSIHTLHPPPSNIHKNPPKAKMMKDTIRSLTPLVAFLAGALHINAAALIPRQGCAIGYFYMWDVSTTLTNQLGDPVTSDWNCVGTSSETSPFNSCHPTEAFPFPCHKPFART